MAILLHKITKGRLQLFDTDNLMYMVFIYPNSTVHILPFSFYCKSKIYDYGEDGVY